MLSIMDTSTSKTPWYRDVLTYGLLLTATVAFSGFSLSARRLHDYGMRYLRESELAAWLVPTAFDLAPLALSLMVYNARKHGRRAIVWRLGIFGFASISAGINYYDARGSDQFTQAVAVLLPLSAVIVLEGIMSEVERRARKDRVFPRVPLSAWIFATGRAWAATKSRALVPLTELEKLLESPDTEDVPTQPTETPRPETPRLIIPSQETVRRVTETVSRETPRPVPSTAPRGLTPELETRIRELLKDEPSITVRRAAEKLDLPPATAGRHLKTVKEKIS